MGLATEKFTSQFLFGLLHRLGSACHVEKVALELNLGLLHGLNSVDRHPYQNQPGPSRRLSTLYSLVHDLWPKESFKNRQLVFQQ